MQAEELKAAHRERARVALSEVCNVAHPAHLSLRHRSAPLIAERVAEACAELTPHLVGAASREGVEEEASGTEAVGAKLKASAHHEPAHHKKDKPKEHHPRHDEALKHTNNSL